MNQDSQAQDYDLQKRVLVDAAANTAAAQWAAIGRGAPVMGAMAVQAGQWAMLGQAMTLAEKAKSYADGYVMAVMGGSRPDMTNRLVKAVYEAGLTACDADITAAQAVVAKNAGRAIRPAMKVSRV